MANGTNEPDRDVEAAAVRALDALTRALESFTSAMNTARETATKFATIAEREIETARRARS